MKQRREWREGSEEGSDGKEGKVSSHERRELLRGGCDGLVGGCREKRGGKRGRRAGSNYGKEKKVNTCTTSKQIELDGPGWSGRIRL